MRNVVMMFTAFVKRSMNSFNARLIALIVSFAFFSSALLGAANMYLAANALNSKLLDDEQTIVSQLAGEIEYFMDDAKGLVEALAISPSLYSMNDRTILETILAVKQRNPQFELLYVMDTTGQQIAKTANTALLNRANRPYFKDAVQGRTFFTDVYISVATNAPCITISTPIKKPGGQIVGVLAADVNLKTLSDISERIKIGQSGYVDIVDRKGNLLAHPNQERVTKYENVANVPYINAVINGKTGIGEGTSTTGIPSLVAYAPSKMLGWGIIAYQPISELQSLVFQYFMITLGMVLVVVIIAGVVGIYVSRSMSRPLSLLAISADNIAGGNLWQAITVRGVDEVNRLADSLDIMRQSLQKIIDAERLAKEQEIRLNRLTTRFVPHEFLKSLSKSNIIEIKPGDHIEEELTVLFTDIRSYTKISENMASVEIFNFINQYLGIAVKVIVKNNGFIDKFIGDAIMGLFTESADDALLAVIELFKELRKYNDNPNVIPIKIGAGIHYGAVTMGTVGTEQRMETTVIGDTVNFASRLESATKAYGMSILISEEVYSKLKNPSSFNIREIDTVKVKGKSVPIKIYEVFDCDDNELKAGKIKTAKLFNEGLLLYKAGNFKEADQKFKECKEICPGDELLSVYIKRCGTLIRIPPGPDWSGVSGI